MSNWQFIGDVTVTPDDSEVVVGDFSIELGDDTIWVEVQKIGGDNSWPWSYGILTWRTDFGNEMGSVKAYTTNAGEVFRLGNGREPRGRSGRLIYEPRSFNLSWIRKGNPLTLEFAAASGVTTSSDLPVFGTRATTIATATPDGDSIDWSIGSDFASLRF